MSISFSDGGTEARRSEMSYQETSLQTVTEGGGSRDGAPGSTESRCLHPGLSVTHFTLDVFLAFASWCRRTCAEAFPEAVHIKIKMRSWSRELLFMVRCHMYLSGSNQKTATTKGLSDREVNRGTSLPR